MGPWLQSYQRNVGWFFGWLGHYFNCLLGPALAIRQSSRQLVAISSSDYSADPPAVPLRLPSSFGELNNLQLLVMTNNLLTGVK